MQGFYLSWAGRNHLRRVWALGHVLVDRLARARLLVGGHELGAVRKLYAPSDVAGMVEAHLKERHGSVYKASQARNINRQFLYRVCRGEKRPPAWLLADMGLTRVIMYFEVIEE